MRKIKHFRTSGDTVSNRNAFRGGSYSLVIISVVLALLIVINVLASSVSSFFNVS